MREECVCVCVCVCACVCVCVDHRDSVQGQTVGVERKDKVRK